MYFASKFNRKFTRVNNDDTNKIKELKHVIKELSTKGLRVKGKAVSGAEFVLVEEATGKGFWLRKDLIDRYCCWLDLLLYHFYVHDEREKTSVTIFERPPSLHPNCMALMKHYFKDVFSNGCHLARSKARKPRYSDSIGRWAIAKSENYLYCLNQRHGCAFSSLHAILDYAVRQHIKVAHTCQTTDADSNEDTEDRRDANKVSFRQVVLSKTKKRQQ